MDNIPVYLLFLEDAFFYMEKYHHRSGLMQIIGELSEILSDETVGTARNRALLLQCRFACEDDPAVGIKYLEEAVSLLPELNEHNADLYSNLHNNIGQCYLEMRNTELVRFHMEEGIHILEDFNMVGYHDSVVQIINYASFLMGHGEAQRGYHALKKLAGIFQQRNHTQRDDYATVLYHLSIVSGIANRFSQAESYLFEAMTIYETVFETMPELLEEKRQVIGQTLQLLRKRAQTVNL